MRFIEIEMETGFGIGPIANLAQLPDRVEACGRRQPTEPVLIKMTTRSEQRTLYTRVTLRASLHPHRSFKILHTFNDDIHGAPMADGEL
jgi:hypothetical protein